LSRELLRVCHHTLRHNLALEASEAALIVTDGTRTAIVAAFEAAAHAFTDRVEMIRIPVADHNGQEPPAEATSRMREADVVLLVGEHSLSWTRARRDATAAGARIASMPHITEEIALRTLPIDYEPIRERVNDLCDRLDEAQEVIVRTAAGTDLTFGIEGRESHGRKGGIYRRPGQWGNLPCGEAFIAPLEGTTRGVYVVDASHAGVGRLAEPIRITVEEGRAVRLDGGPEARQLDETLRSVDDPRAYNVAELGIGCNPAARITGVTLEDEKALGTCHVALGRNDLFGGTVEVDIHLDGILRVPTILIDGHGLDEP
jgi:leucyl aminopeptidase (aminopeptidase T)